MLLPKSSFVFIPCINSVAPRVCWPKYYFWPDMKTEMGVVISMYLKHSPDYIDSIYIYMVHGSNSQGSSVMAEIPFLTFLVLHRESRCDPANVTLRVKLYIHTKFSICSSKVFLQKCHFWLFLL